MNRLFYVICGIVLFVLGIVGLFLPIIPQVPFFLAAIFCFSKASRRFNRFIKKTRVYKFLYAKKEEYGKGAVIFYGVMIVLFITAVIIIYHFFKTPAAEEIKASFERDENVFLKNIEVHLTKRQREDLVYDILRENGYTVAATCGILGNIAVECTEFEPDTTRNDGLAYGLFQWTDVGDRRGKLKKWCNENGYDYTTIEGQVYFAIYELEGGDSIACRLNNYLKKTDDAYTAAVEFAAGFERCVGTTGVKDGKYTGGIYPEYYGEKYQALNLRINRAMNYYERYSKEEGID